jgi:hypothetical protein
VLDDAAARSCARALGVAESQPLLLRRVPSGGRPPRPSGSPGRPAAGWPGCPRERGGPHQVETGDCDHGRRREEDRVRCPDGGEMPDSDQEQEPGAAQREAQDGFRGVPRLRTLRQGIHGDADPPTLASTHTAAPLRRRSTPPPPAGAARGGILNRALLGAGQAHRSGTSTSCSSP